MPYQKNKTNYSKAELSRKATVAAEKIVRQREIKRKSKAATDKINSTWAGNKPTNKVKASKTTKQLRAIYAKKK